MVAGSSNELSMHPFPSEQLQVLIASEEAHLPLPYIPREFSEPTAYIALATFFPLRSIQMLERENMRSSSFVDFIAFLTEEAEKIRSSCLQRVPLFLINQM